jgi:hypothetical protein
MPAVQQGREFGRLRPAQQHRHLDAVGRNGRHDARFDIVPARRVNQRRAPPLGAGRGGIEIQEDRARSKEWRRLLCHGQRIGRGHGRDDEIAGRAQRSGRGLRRHAGQRRLGQFGRLRGRVGELHVPGGHGGYARFVFQAGTEYLADFAIADEADTFYFHEVIR